MFNKRKGRVNVLLKRHRDMNGGHHHIIMDSVKDNYVSVGTTTKNKKGHNSTNYACDNDILGNGERTYLRRQAIVDKKKNYHGVRVGSMTEKDYNQALIYAERAKDKFFAKKK